MLKEDGKYTTPHLWSGGTFTTYDRRLLDESEARRFDLGTEEVATAWGGDGRMVFIPKQRRSDGTTVVPYVQRSYSKFQVASHKSVSLGASTELVGW